jgi:metal-dependent amidase/aminoacylase/carboxypeptidase family protein
VKSIGGKVTPLHTSTFDIDEGALLIGVRLFAEALLEWPKEAGLRRKV